MIAYHGSYNGRFAPALGQAPAVPAAPPTTPVPAAAPPAPPEAAPPAPPADQGPPTVSIGGVKISVWTVAIAGAVILGGVGVVTASAAAMERGRR